MADNEYNVDSWLSRIQKAQDYWKRWNQKFKCAITELYYEGFQWREQSDYQPYVANFVFSTIEVKLPSLLFSVPSYQIKPKPSRENWDFDSAAIKAKLRQDVLNHIVMDKDIGFAEEIELCILDAFFSFAILEVGYDANFLINPNANKPVGFDSSDYNKDEEEIKEPEKLPEWENVYFKRIHPDQFRVGAFDSYKLSRCNWCGYYEFVYANDILESPLNKKGDLDRKDLRFAGARTDDFFTTNDEINALLKTGDVIKLWKLWNNREKSFCIIADAQETELYESDFKRLPLFPLMFHKRRRGFYPIPPASQWISPQDEINDAIEQRRRHRKRADRKYLYRNGSIDEQELSKVLRSGDGTFGMTEGPPAEAVAPLPLAPLDQSINESMNVSKDVFNIVSGTTSEERSVADRQTATQSKILDTKSAIRDSKPKMQIATWLNGIGYEALKQAERITTPFWIKVAADPEEDFASVQSVEQQYRSVIGSDLESGEFEGDFEVDINITSMSPVDVQEEKRAFMEFMSMLQHFPELSLDPVLIRKAAELTGFRNEQVIKRMQTVAQVAMLGRLAQAEAANNQIQQSQASQAIVAQETPNTQGQIDNQLKNQVTQGIVQ